MNPTLLKLLRGCDTPTICNAIEVAQGKRGFDAFTRGTMIASAPAEPPMVGYAVTAQLRASAPSMAPPEAVRAQRMAYYRAMYEASKPSIAVVEDLDFPDCIGAYWGEVNTTIHKAFGLSGALTNGVVRDLGDLPEGFPVVAGSIGPSHGFVHVVSVGDPVTIFGLRIATGDLVHADRHGAVVIPPEVVPDLEAAIGKLRGSEYVILAPMRAGLESFGEFEEAWRRFEASRV
ncbi:RraA family protein [Microvirga sp. BT688]|uniref:RraA family protein n=1 Tax=Microvirga sp. TaxID=1873136 RepID=UPI0016822A3B|nr:RraA family protein [Microvirga sp.]MBD2750876.1 RraA family protein [Microvirga sp.]